jgi:hypothetical protein
MINELYAIHRGRITKSEVQVALLVHRWFIADTWRLLLIAGAFVCAIRSISIPYALRDESKPLAP